MRIIEIKALDNGGHRNQTGNIQTIPKGWAVIPDDMETKNFPFGEVTVEIIDGIPTVASWKAGTIPKTPTKEEITTQERLEALEAAMLEMAIGGTE